MVEAVAFCDGLNARLPKDKIVFFGGGQGADCLKKFRGIFSYNSAEQNYIRGEAKVRRSAIGAAYRQHTLLNKLLTYAAR